MDHRLDRETPLSPATAAAAIIIVDGRFLLQLRDNKRGVFFPCHWGCFGGATDPGESPETTLLRELHEELGVRFEAGDLRYFTRFDFDLGFAKLKPISRDFYVLETSPAVLATLRLSEGQEMRLFDADDVLTGAIPITPYDGFALWLYINRGRLRP